MSNLRLLTLAFALAACGPRAGGNSESDSPDAGNAPPVDAGVDAGTPLAECEAAIPACEDEIIEGLNLQRPTAPGLLANTQDGANWLTEIDATAGGAFTDTPDSYVYATFGETGLTKVDLGDQDSLESMDWDIAFRRYVVRINSGDSGPSCVRAARVPPGHTYEDLTTVADDLIWRIDDDFNDACVLVADGSGLPNSPDTALASYWKYDGCLKMSGNVFVIELRSGHHVKLTVTSYYQPADQTNCDEHGTAGTSSGHIHTKWAFID